jgi:hypothetical protein
MKKVLFVFALVATSSMVSFAQNKPADAKVGKHMPTAQTNAKPATAEPAAKAGGNTVPAVTDAKPAVVKDSKAKMKSNKRTPVATGDKTANPAGK